MRAKSEKRKRFERRRKEAKLTFNLEHKFALVSRVLAHGLVPYFALVDGLMLVGAGHEAQQAAGRDSIVALLDPDETGRRLAELFAVLEPAYGGLRVSALSGAVELILLAFARQRSQPVGGRHDRRLRRDFGWENSFLGLVFVFGVTTLDQG